MPWDSADTYPVASHDLKRRMRVREMDFTRPAKFSAEEQRRLEQLHETFCRRASLSFSLELHSGLELDVIDAEQTIWQAALDDFDQGSVGAICTTREGQQILIISEMPILLRLVNMMLGGGHSRPLDERNLTDIDREIVAHFMESMTKILSDTWNDFAGIEFAFARVEADKTAIYPMAALNEAVLTIVIEAKMADISGAIILVFPHHAIASVQKILQSTSFRSSGKKLRADAAQLALQPAEVKVYAEAASLQMSIGQLMDLQVGDELDLGLLPEEIDLYVENEPVYRAAAGYDGERHIVVVRGRKDGEEVGE